VKNKLILTNLTKMKTLDENVTKLLIARKPINNLEKYKLHHIIQLAPSNNLFFNMKSNTISWNEYVWQYRSEMIKNKKILQYIYDKLDCYEIALICYCSDKHCHRYILGNYFKELDIKVEDV